MSDPIARLAALAAAVVALAALVVAVLAYRRGGARPSARLYHMNNFGPGDAKEFLIATTVTNGALGAVQVVTVELEVQGVRGRHMLGGQGRRGPELPFRLEGQQSATWTVPAADVAELLRVYDKNPARIRAVLALGTGRTVKGGWFRFDLDKWAAGVIPAPRTGGSKQAAAPAKAKG
ncbi:hypothetical protein QEZ54_01100 [Catellatospora sp. KI3]|uniref:hypothetical protein n=1 Tax=Catellatospora sp. KI3 TaxID=3041620 RepID=UPI00248318D0|nr:hypothetical protein [Catellatospora sp. KI3]MDI1459553.1 hypothetical protein [Catellatospora sp. KI3]